MPGAEPGRDGHDGGVESASDTAQRSLAASRAPTRRLTIDFEVGVEPLTGTLRADEATYPFAGWLALASALGKATRWDREPAP